MVIVNMWEVGFLPPTPCAAHPHPPGAGHSRGVLGQKKCHAFVHGDLTQWTKLFLYTHSNMPGVHPQETKQYNLQIVN
jgi:hypothetical protein